MGGHPYGTSRRQFLRLLGASAAAMAAGGVLAACGSQGQQKAPAGGSTPGSSGNQTPQTITLTFWNGLTGPDGRVMEQLVAEFTSQNPHIKVEQQQIPWVDFYTKMLTAIPAGEGPVVALMHTHEIPRFARDGLITEFLESELQGLDLDPGNFFPIAVEGGKYQGKRYGIPLDVHCMGLYINNALFKKAGLWEGDRPKVPTNRDEFLQMAKALTKGDEYGLAFAQRSTWQFEMFVWQNGGDLFDKNENPTLDTPAVIEAAQFYRDLYQTYKITPNGITNSLEAFRTGKFGMMINGGWNIPGLEAANMEFTVAPIPQLFKQKAVWAGSHQFVLPTPKKKDEAARKAALQFISWISKRGATWAAKGGHVPANRKVLETPDFKNLKHQAVLAAQEPHWRYQPATPKIIELETRLPAVLESIFLGQAQPEQALKALNDEMKRIRL